MLEIKAGSKLGNVANITILVFEPPAAVTASLGPSSRFSIASEKSLASIPTEWKPKASTPAADPGPTALINIKAKTISGNERIIAKTILPVRDTYHFLCLVCAAQKANGKEMMAEMNVPKKAIQTVSHSCETRSSPVPL